VPFSEFSAKLDVIPGHFSEFELRASFTQGAGAIDLATQDLTLSIGSYSVTVPAGSFHDVGKRAFAFTDIHNRKALEIILVKMGANSYRSEEAVRGADSDTVADPVAVTLTVGYNTGTALVTVRDR
jgi:hypothetical protein